jgi:hypothetical protein
VAVAGAGGGAAVGGEIPIGTGLAITPDAMGWVSGDTNGLGVQGAFFIAHDGVSAAGTPTTTGSTMTVSYATPGSVCVQGNFPAIPPDPTLTEGDFLYSTHWGGGVGMNLRQVIPAGGGMALPASGWPRTTPAGTVTAFNYTLTAQAGSTLPPLRFTVDFVGKPAGATFCQTLPLGSTTAPLASTVQSCWETTAATVLPGADLLTIQWSIIPNTTTPTPFNFCLSGVSAAVTP